MAYSKKLKIFIQNISYAELAVPFWYKISLFDDSLGLDLGVCGLGDVYGPILSPRV